MSDLALEELFYGPEVVFRILSSDTDRNISVTTVQTDSGDEFE